jgi:hypothetical protein
VRWHSRSRGESFFGSERPIRDFVIDYIVATLLCNVSIFYAGFFVFSRAQSYLARWLGWRQLYNRYLDIVDANIESEFMEVALKDGFPPRQTDGLYMPLPKFLKGEPRAKVARVAAGIQLPKGGVTGQQPVPSTQSQGLAEAKTAAVQAAGQEAV